jgi:enterochelin esterase-like enzyme
VECPFGALGVGGRQLAAELFVESTLLWFVAAVLGLARGWWTWWRLRCSALTFLRGGRRMWILLWLFVTSRAYGQAIAPAPPAFDAPVVHKNGPITFRITAPLAQAVALHGEWMAQGASEPMRRQPDGAWSLTVGPLPPDLYLYAFEVDGVRVPDPLNRFVKNGYPGMSSLLEVPGAGFLSIRSVPHGTVHIHTYASRAESSPRRLHVYTPPGYDSARSQTYPVLFLLHGSWDNDSDWVHVGRAGIILDNLLAERKAAPMLIVMPDGHPYPSFATATRARNLDDLRRDLLEKILPLVERAYRVTRNPKGRAIAGFSMGGTQALHLGLSSIELFGSIGVFSAPGDVPDGRTFEEALRQSLRSAARLDLFWLACGRGDALFGRAEQVHAVLVRHGIRHVWRETDGGHTWMVWRRYLAELAQMLFKPNVTTREKL